MLKPLLPDSKPIDCRYELPCLKSVNFIGLIVSRFDKETKLKFRSQTFIPRIKSSTIIYKKFSLVIYNKSLSLHWIFLIYTTKFELEKGWK